MDRKDLLAADLATRPLVRRLCASFLGPQAAWTPEERRHALSRLEDTAYSVLLGLHPEVVPAYVEPDQRAAGVSAGVAAARAALDSDGFPSLAHDLSAAAEKLQRCTAYHLLGSHNEAETGAVLVLPLREQPALLSLLLSLRGTQPSLRKQRFTFQCETRTAGSDAKAGLQAADAEGTFWPHSSGSSGTSGPPTPPLLGSSAALPAPLTTSVFEEAPDPDALTHGSAAVAVLLPGELGLPVEAMAGCEEVQDLARGLGSRPVWDPASAAALPPLRSPAWLPVPPALLELRGDARRGARPAPLGLPLSLLGMADEPGCGTLFAADAAPDWALDGDAASADSVQPVLGPRGGGSSPDWRAAAREDGAPAAGAGQPGLSVRLWSLEEAELAQHALLALQGVAASLARLRALLCAPGALPRRSVASLLHRLTAAAELRQHLQRFVAAFSSVAATGGRPSSRGSTRMAAREDLGFRSGGSGSGSGSNSATEDPVQHAFAVAVAEVLRRQSAALQQLEQQHSVDWVQATRAGGARGVQLRRRGPTLLQVALHSGRLQLQLRRLADLCWCVPASQQQGEEEEEEEEDEEMAEAGEQRGGSGGGGVPASGECAWQAGGFPRGTDLLAYLYSRANEADSVDAPMLRFLFVRALQPYLLHLHSWAFTTHAVSAEFGVAGEKEAFTLEFLAPEERNPGQLVPVDPPAFLQPLHAALMRAGCQLRLLHSLEPQGRQLAQRLADVAERETAARRQQQAGASLAMGPSQGHTFTSFAALPGTQPEEGSLGQTAEVEGSEREPWLALGGAVAAPGAGGADDASPELQLSSSSLQLAVRISEEQDLARAAVVEEWLSGMALRRRLAEHAVVSEQQGRAAAQREQQAERTAQRAAALSRQQSAKAALFEEQRAAFREQRARQALQQEREAASDRQGQLLAAQQEHAAAVAELQRALGGAGRPTAEASAQHTAALEPVAGAPAPSDAVGTAPDQDQRSAGAAPAAGASDPPPEGQRTAQDVQQPAAVAVWRELPPAGLVRPTRPRPPGLPPLKLQSRQHSQREGEEQQENAWLQFGGLPAGYTAATVSARGMLPSGFAAVPQPGWPLPSARRLSVPGPLGLPAPIPQPAMPRHLAGFAPPLPTARDVGGWAEAAAGAAEDEEALSSEALAPLSAALECCVTQSILSQYRAVSRACVRLFLDELKALEHLEALRRFFFMEGGDWADALVARLGAHADSLQPLAEHQLEEMLAASVRGTSAECDPYAPHLCIRLLPSAASTINAQLGAISTPTPQRRARGVYSTNHVVTLAPTRVDSLDCVRLDYQVGWPLSAVITEDTLQGYAAVFSAMARVRRAALLLRGLHAALAVQPKSTVDLLLSEEDEDFAHRRIQRLRAFHFGAGQLVAALQAFLHSRTSGDAWVHLLAKLMVSSEEVAATLISREPDAPSTGVLSRMHSVGPAGKAAHKLAQHLSRTLSASQPGSPPGGPPATARGGATARLARFNSLLSAASAASSAANSAATSPRGGAPLTARQPSRFAGASRGQGPGGTAPAGVLRVPSSSREVPEASGAGSPTAATVGGGGLSRRTSCASEVFGAADLGMPGDVAVERMDGAAWARSYQQSQQGIADLQELVDLHRRYVRHASDECLTLGGSPEVGAAVEGVLQCLLDFCYRLRGAVQRGAGTRAEETWAQSLRLDATWRPLAADMAAFEERVQQLQGLLQCASGSSAVAQLSQQLDFNGFYRQRHLVREERAQRERRRSAAAAAETAAG